MPSCLCSNIRRASRVVSRIYDMALAPTGLTVMQLETLDTITDRGEATLTEIAAANAHERSAAWRGLRPLIARGLVRQTAAGAGDRYAVTPEGAAVFDQAVALWRGVQARVAAHLGEDAERVIAIADKLDALAEETKPG